MKTPQKLLVKLLAIGISFTAFTCPTLAKGDGGLIYLSSGARFMDVAPLTQAVTSGNTLPGTPSGLFWDNGVGALATVNQFLVGFEYHSLWGQLLQDNTRAFNIDGNYALLHLGYAAVATPQAQIYPYIGIGPGRIGLRSTGSLHDSLNIRQGEREDIYRAEGLSWVMDFGVGANYIFPLSRGGNDQRGSALGLRAGYLWSVNATQWGVNQLPAQGGPAGLSVGGWYLNATLGFGGFRS